jgi:hypothetical protein
VRLLADDVDEDGVRVLRLVEEDELGVDPRPAQVPHLQVVVVLEGERAVLVGEVGPGTPHRGDERAGDRVVVGAVAASVLDRRDVDPADVGDVPLGWLAVGALAEAGDAAHRETGEVRPGEPLALAAGEGEVDRVEAEPVGDLGRLHPAAVAEPLREARPRDDAAVGERVRGRAGDVRGELLARLDDDRLVEGDVLAAPLGRAGEHDEHRGLAGSGSGLDREAAAGSEQTESLGLLGGGC